jgi:hypothetical protein
MLRREFGKTASLREEKRRRRDNEGLRPMLLEFRKRGPEIVWAFHLQRLKAHAEGSCGDL